MTDSIIAELIEIDALLGDGQLSDGDRFALYGAQQALRNVLEPSLWQTASQCFCRAGAKRSDPPRKTEH